MPYPSGELTKGPNTMWDAPGMQRIKIPGGGMNADQLETMADLAEEYSDGIAHVTTRQDFQLHYIHIDDTPALMRRILEIKCARGGPMSLSFSREKLHIALNCARDLFEPNPGSSAYSITQIQVFLSQVRSVLSLIDMLNLNTRIWSKRMDGRPSCG